MRDTDTRRSSDPRDTLIGRVGLVATGAFLLLSAELSKSLGALQSHDEVVVGEMFLYLFAFALFIIAGSKLGLVKYAGTLALAGTLLGITISFYATVAAVGQGNYLFDILPLTHRSAEMVLDGENPYSIRENPDFIRENAARYNSPLFTFTHEGDGELIGQLLTYPAGHVVAFLPAVALGVKDVRWVTAIASLAVALVMWLGSPSYLRPVAILPLLVNNLIIWLGAAVGGLTDFVWLLPLMGVAFALKERRLGWAAVFYGIAASIRQQAWVLAPFLFIWLWLANNRDEPLKPKAIWVGRLTALSFGVFLLINLPFIIWNPSDWLHGILYVIVTDHGNVGSTGLSDIKFFGIDEGQRFYTVATILATLALMALFAWKFEKLQNAFWVFPAVILWFTQRAFAYYFFPWFLLLMFAVLVWERAKEDGQQEPGSQVEVA